MRLRPGRDEDGDALVALIAACWAEYPGCVMDESENAHLRAPATYYANRGGTLTVAEDEAGRVVACVSSLPAADGDLELKGLYVEASRRGTGLAPMLLRSVEKEAQARNARRLILWSDTRFTRAHRFYERQSFVAAGAIRALNDLSNSLEYPYAKPMRLRAVERLDAASSRTAIRALADLVHDEPFWQSVTQAVVAGGAALFGAWYNGKLSGVLVLDMPHLPTERHRADLRLLHVGPHARRIGLASELLATAERSCGRTLLTAWAIGTGEPFLEACGFHAVGRVPGFTRDIHGQPVDGVLFWRAFEHHARTPT